MKKFKFRFEQVLQLRTYEEEECKSRLVQINSEINKIREGLEHLAVIKKKNTLNIVSDKSDINYRRNIDLYDQKIQLDIEHHLLQLAKLEEQKVILNKEYIESRKACKTLLNLQEKEIEIYKKDWLKYEEKQIDDLVTTRTGTYKKES
ncbi:hypothetical protein [Spirochaeta cellobiosiphila]|uniref:hypothetical protein n=1 Tax=Spirochaeta cellobiosiphila TaxID=504483 RepID=UPI0004023245|nr:hypothetical protein [Spirochaeta cellobiosiphila]